MAIQQHVLVEAKDLIEKVEEELESKAAATKNCCHVVFPNWLSRYNVGKHLERMTKTVKQFNERLTEAPNRVPSQLTIKRCNNVSIFESRKSPYYEILAALEDDAVDMIGLYGMGGSGKTFLIKEVCNQLKRVKSFDEVAFAVVSNSADMRRIQGQIAHDLGFRLDCDMDETARAKNYP
ncbi:putative disease resistance protein At4g10780 [Neltuma alba]|uniref:putative disease resistance protein At4g10780 n=1 Tax=Neltuma alba TaxID=207710 RepID=UPI0010A38204|nr:putative disease resistance protein At4g10780 [Prosopis alba]